MVGRPVVIVKEDVAVEIAALRNVLWAADGRHSGNSSNHGYRGQTDGYFSGKL